MSDSPNQTLKIVAAITGYTLRKSADGTEKYVLSGMASNTNIDLTGERMADSALTAMVKSLESTAVTINNEHGNSWDDDFGEVTKLWVTDDHELMDCMGSRDMRLQVGVRSLHLQSLMWSEVIVLVLPRPQSNASDLQVKLAVIALEPTLGLGPRASVLPQMCSTS